MTRRAKKPDEAAPPGPKSALAVLEELLGEEARENELRDQQFVAAHEEELRRANERRKREELGSWPVEKVRQMARLGRITPDDVRVWFEERERALALFLEVSGIVLSAKMCGDHARVVRTANGEVAVEVRPGGQYRSTFVSGYSNPGQFGRR